MKRRQLEGQSVRVLGADLLARPPSAGADTDR